MQPRPPTCRFIPRFAVAVSLGPLSRLDALAVSRSQRSIAQPRCLRSMASTIARWRSDCRAVRYLLVAALLRRPGSTFNSSRRLDAQWRTSNAQTFRSAPNRHFRSWFAIYHPESRPTRAWKDVVTPETTGPCGPAPAEPRPDQQHGRRCRECQVQEFLFVCGSRRARAARDQRTNYGFCNRTAGQHLWTPLICRRIIQGVGREFHSVRAG